MPEEIANDRPDRLRVAFVLNANPLRSYADTTAYEEAFGRLDLLVVTEIAMSETAALAHYVLPCRSAYESWDATIFSMHFPDVYFQMRRPVVEVEGEQKEAGEIFTRLADAMGLIPALPDSLYKAAGSGSLKTYRDALIGYVMEHPNREGALPSQPRRWAMPSVPPTWPLFHRVFQRSPDKQEEAARVGFDAGPDQGLGPLPGHHRPSGRRAGRSTGYPEKILVDWPQRTAGYGFIPQRREEWIKEISPVRKRNG